MLKMWFLFCALRVVRIYLIKANIQNKVRCRYPTDGRTFGEVSQIWLSSLSYLRVVLATVEQQLAHAAGCV